ncbi:MAG: PqiC family protein [Steroidobacteraceae bacterium]
MNRRIRVGAPLALAAVIAGCSSTPPSSFYGLSVVSTPAAAASYVSVQVGPVTIPASVDRAQFVLNTGPNEVTLDEYHRWSAPLDRAIADVLVGDLAALLGSPNVTTMSGGFGDESPYRVGVQVQRFESRLDSSATFDAAWTVRRPDDGRTLSGRTSVQQPATGGYAGLAVAYSQAVGRLAADVAAAVRQLEATPAAAK